MPLFQRPPPSNLNYVKSGTIHAVVAQRTDLIGYLGVKYLKKYIDEGSLPKEIYDTGITLVTQYNVDTYRNFDSDIDREVTTVKVGYYAEENFLAGK
ncbi:MAG: hypothetical protein NC131_04430 [Roseburia sp.]|nr:hypothetical protein [Roseburia sp.]